MARSRRLRRGLTLPEIMLSVSLVVVMSAVGWASIEGALEMNDALAATDGTTRTARAVLSKLRRELQLAYLTPQRQTANTYLTVFVGEDGDPDTVWFASLSHQRLYANSREADQTEVTVWGERAPREHGPGDVLFHREAPRIDHEPSEGGKVLPLAYHVETFDLKYLDGRTGEWVDRWDTRSGDTPYLLPRAVRIGLVLLQPDADDPRDQQEIPFLTTVPLEYADPLPSLLGGPGGQLPQSADAPPVVQ